MYIFRIIKKKYCRFNNLVTDNILQVNLEGNFILLLKIVVGVTWLVLNYFKSKIIKLRNKILFAFLYFWASKYFKNM